VLVLSALGAPTTAEVTPTVPLSMTKFSARSTPTTWQASLASTKHQSRQCKKRISAFRRPSLASTWHLCSRIRTRSTTQRSAPTNKTAFPCARGRATRAACSPARPALTCSPASGTTRSAASTTRRVPTSFRRVATLSPSQRRSLSAEPTPRRTARTSMRPTPRWSIRR